ncbi:MAG TPA: isochorismatase family cysteine hydrolase [Cyanophyceae cyanobacterium]
MYQAVTISARPEAITLNPRETAVIVVDMHNAFALKSGGFDSLRIDETGAKAIIETINSVLHVSRQAGMPIIFLQNSWSTQINEVSSSLSQHWHKSDAIRLIRDRAAPPGKETSPKAWDSKLIEGITPQPEDFVLQKHRYSGFWGTHLDRLLRGRCIRNLIFTGVATSVCVESTLRDSFSLKYCPILLSDAMLQIGPQSIQNATLGNVEKFFGRVSTTSEYITALKGVLSSTQKVHSLF